ncbi:hypothetical protein [Aeromicrobium ginsengisoli]|uniref:Peptidase M11 gametolysin domain-containing protein n=1 Tax=Aeromicrobium ginsengisoli TaxID=363867 RepID=A0A5M4FB22_9ACTN|nr:hypothetical protein [Aeromicrobium ginsengisoli]KAA1395467.1 hypothetical protein ESP70_015025 [Aeromicrobium ginsengisoli]
MRTRLALAAVLSWFVAATLVGPGPAMAAPTAAAPAGRHYEDPRYADHAAVAVDGTLIQTEIDQFGTSPASSTAYAVRIDDGTLVPVSVTSELPANSRFRGELAITGHASKALKAKGLMPAAGRTIDEDTSAGSIALTAAAQGAALPVAEATVTAPAVAAAPTPQTHRAYVAKLTDQGSVDGSDAEIGAKVDDMLAYWTTESDGAITSFSRVGTIKAFDSTADIPASQGCGIRTPDTLWNQARLLFPGVDFSTPGNHLIVLLGDECGNAGPVGQAQVGTSIANGGMSMVTVDDTFKQVGVHELGHNFGLEHANLDTCPTPSVCEYYDLYSPMSLAVSGGAFEPPALGTLFRSELGLTDTVTTVSLPADSLLHTQAVALSPRSSADGTRGLLVTDPVTGTTYSVDLRSRTLRDADTFYGSGFTISDDLRYPLGVVIERQTTIAGTPNATYLMTHSFGGRDIGAFAAGEAFEPSAGLKVAVNALSSTSASVTVTVKRPTVASSAPTLSSTPKVGVLVTAIEGTWDSQAFNYQWRLDGVAIPGATQRTYKPTVAGKTLAVEVTGTRTGYLSATRTSSGTVVARGTFTTVLPTITGTPKVGYTLRAHHGIWSPTPTWRYRWYSNGSPISGATSSYYVVTKPRVGQRITVKVTGSKAYYVTASRTSARTSTVTR